MASRSRAATSLLLILAATTGSYASRRPKYGGTLRVEVRGDVASLDPREWRPETSAALLGEKLAPLVYERLVSLDAHGRFTAQVAASWKHDADFKHWQFTLRPGVVFSDGSALTGADAAAALGPLLPLGQQIIANGESITIESTSPMPDLLEELASGRSFIFRALPNGELLGTGPFVLSQWRANAGVAGGTPEFRSRFVANERAWSGRPFLDSVEVLAGVPPLRQLLDLQLGRADLVELEPDLFRRADQARLRTWSSDSVLLVALVFNAQLAPVQDARLREAISLSIDRATMAGVLLQKQAEPAAALLPAWLSGYAFLFTMETNTERAKSLRAAIPANLASIAEPLVLSVDAPGDIPRLLAERVVVNAHQSGLSMRVLPSSGAARTTSASGPIGATGVAPAAVLQPDVHLIRWRVPSLAPREALDSLVSSLGVSEPAGASSSADPEQLVRRERELLEARFVLPLVYLPESVALGPAVRDWMPTAWGEWRLENIWLDRPADAAPENVPPGRASQAGARP